MRALRSRNLQSGSDNNENKSEDVEYSTEETSIKKTKRKKHKKRTSDENGQHFEQVPEEIVVKKRKSMKLKKQLTNRNDEYKTSTNTLNVNTSTENDLQEVVVKKKKSKKIKKQPTKDDSKYETNTKPLNISTETTSENEQQEKVAKKKKSKKIKKSLMTGDTENEENTKSLHISTENTSETDQHEVIVKKKKAKKIKKSMKENENNSDIQSAETDQEVFKTSPKDEQEIEEDTDKISKKTGRKHRQFLRSSIFGIPNFDNAVTSTAMKPRRPENIKDDEFSVDVNNIKPLKRESQLHQQTAVYVPSRRETFVMPKSKILNETADILNEIENNLQDKSKSKVEKIQKRVSGNLINGSRSSDSRRQTFDKLSKLPMDSVIAISDSPDISKFSKTKTLEPEITSDEESETSTLKEKSKTRESVPSRRETFSKLPKNKILLPGLENTIITISDSPDKTRKGNTFNKSNESQPEITSDEDSATKDSSTLKKLNDSKLKTPNQSLNNTKTKDRLSTKNDSIGSLRETFCKTPKNIRKSENVFTDKTTPIKSDNKRKSERLSDVGDSILEDVIDIDSPETTRRTRSTFNLSNNTVNETNIANTSGDWQIENKETKTDKLNGTFDVENKENKSANSSKGSNTTITIDSEKLTLQTENLLDKSIRKKWLKFPRHSSDAQSVLESISSPRLQKKMNASKIAEKVLKTPTDLLKLQKPSIASSSLSVQKNSAKKTPKSLKKSPFKSAKKSLITSSKKSTTKRTVMPNFALIHQKAYEKMENLAEYSERKKQRAQLLLSNNPSSKRKSSTKQEEPKGKSSRQLFTIETKTTETNATKKVKDDVKLNRFGFKFGEPISKASQIPVVKPFKSVPVVKTTPLLKPVVKPSVFARSEVVAIANKNKVVANNRDKRKDQLKGVRTNRRFELLMQMRNKQ